LGQSRFWFLNLYIEDKTTFNVSFFHNIRGRIRVSDLSRALKEVGQAHEALRTCFFVDDSDDTVWQGVMPQTKLKLEHKMINDDSGVLREYEEVRHTIYDLAQGETMRVVLLSKDENTHAIIFSYHHIIMDGVSFQIFLADFEKAYNREPLTLPERQYPALSTEQRRELENGSLRDSIAFWLQEFKELPPPLPLLPVAKTTSRRPILQYKSNSAMYRLEASLALKVKQRCREERATPFHFYLATFKAMLLRLTNVNHLSIGVADANRIQSHVLGTLGVLLNILPLSFRDGSSQTFLEALGESRAKTYEALQHSAVPFDEILNRLHVTRSNSYSPLFQAFFDYRTGAREMMKFGNLQFRIAAADLGGTAYDVSLDITEGSAGSLVILRGQEYLYGTREIEGLLSCYITLLRQFADDPSILLNQAELYSQSEVKKALDLGRGMNIRSCLE
jgi:hybrid polyketide synthase/nonribosomal peptide synthetase ACE1